jgi:hypothetical protein
LKAFDVASDTTGRGHDIQALGYGAVGLYLRFDRTSVAMVEGLHSVGIKVFSIYELGYPTKMSYFTATQGTHDGLAACQTAKVLGQPQGTSIFAAFDYDPTVQDINGPLKDYMAAFRTQCQKFGYLASAYGSGLLLQAYTNLGICHHSFLAGSTGWSGYENFKDKASILQGASASVLGMDVDLDEVRDLSVLW